MAKPRTFLNITHLYIWITIKWRRKVYLHHSYSFLQLRLRLQIKWMQHLFIYLFFINRHQNSNENNWYLEFVAEEDSDSSQELVFRQPPGNKANIFYSMFIPIVKSPLHSEFHFVTGCFKDRIVCWQPLHAEGNPLPSLDEENTEVTLWCTS